MHIRLVSLIAAALAATLILGGPARAEENVALVNGQPITQSQLVAELLARYGYQVRESLIIAAVVEQEAKKRGVNATEAEIDQAYATQKAEMEGQTGDRFEDWLAKQGITIATYRAQLRRNVLLRKMVEGDITEEQIKSVYQKLPPRPEALHLTAIHMQDKAEAETLRADLVAGKITWAQAAEKHNLDPRALDAQGKHIPSDQGWTPKANLREEVVASLQRDGDITPVMEYQGTWSLVRREGYRPAGQAPYDEVREDLRMQLVMEAAQRRMISLRDVADIKKFGDFKQPGQ